MSKTHQPLLTVSLLAAEEIPANRFVDFDGNKANAEAALGVSEFGVAAGEQIPVVAMGIALVEAGGTVTKGGLVKADSVGRAVDLGASGTPLGRALDAGSSGRMVRVALFMTNVTIV